MKKLISFILVIAILCSTGIMSFAVTGEGSVLNPYLIETAEDVLAIADDLSAHYMLAADIDMSAVTDFYPIGNSRSGAFTGSFDGNGYKISNLSIITPREKYTGFIGYNEGTIKNLTLENVYVEGDRYTGGITGYNSSESIVMNCSVSGIVKVEEAPTVSLNVGGAVGYNVGEVENITCAVDVNVSSADIVYGTINTGGLIGYNIGNIINSGYEGEITVIPETECNGVIYTGGIAGYHSGTATEILSDSVIIVRPVGKVTADIITGGSIGYNIGNIINSGYEGEITVIPETGCNGAIYTGGIAGYHSGTATEISSDSLITVCPVGNVNADVITGGVLGYNSGAATVLESFGGVTVSPLKHVNSIYTGGVIGVNEGSVDDLNNYANVLSSPKLTVNSLASGGLIGFNKAKLDLTDVSNSGQIEINTTSNEDGSQYRVRYFGGLIGYSIANINISDSINKGAVSVLVADTIPYVGGIIGYSSSSSTIMGCVNTADVIAKTTGYYYSSGGSVFFSSSSKACSAGIIAYAKTATLSRCFNCGNIKSMTTGSTTGVCYAGGISLDTTSNISCANYGEIYTSGNGSLYAYGISSQKAEKSINLGYINKISGKIISGSHVDSVSISNYTDSTSSNSYVGKYEKLYRRYFEVNKNLLNFDNIWKTDSRINGGIPYFRYQDEWPLMSDTVKDVCIGDSFKLYVFQNGERVSVSKWVSSDSKIASVSSDGVVTASTVGSAYITAVTEDGMKTNCWVNVFGSPEINTEMNDVTINIDNSATIQSVSDVSDEFVGDVSSSEPTVCTVDLTEKVTGSKNIKITGVSEGTATITVTTVLGTVKTFNVTVTNNANGVTLPSTCKLNRGETYKLNATLNPAGADSKLMWISSNDAIVTVDENGVLTGNNTGTTMVSVMTDNGYVASCNVTVVAPVKSFSFESNPLVLIKGTTGYVNAIPNPIDTTDTITYSSSNTSYATVNSSTGLVTAVKTGSAIITAKSSSGVIGQCAVVIEDEKIPVESITLNRNSLYLKGGESQLLSVALAPENATNKRVKWSVADPSIASVSDNGVVTGLASGTTVVTVSDYDETVFAECTVNVIIDVTGVSFENSEIQINESESRQLTAIIEPVGATNQNVSWSSSDESVVTVDENGVITAISKGYATITVTTEDWAKTATCIVMVIKPITEFEISRKSASVVCGETLNLSVGFAPSDATFTDFTWSSSNPSVAAVDENGCVTTLKAGNTTITVTNGNGNTATCKFRVTPNTPSIEIYNFSHSYEQKLDLFDSYSDAKMKLGFHSYNCEDAVRFEWSSSNRRVKIDKDGNITNTGFFGRSSTITIKAIDAQGKVIARKSVKVMFYKLQWQKDRLQSQSIVSDNYLNRNLSAQALEASSENETIAFFSHIIEFLKRTFILLKI